MALVAVAGAVFYVVSTSTDSGNGGDDKATRTVQQQKPQNGKKQQRPRKQRAFYVVKLNDTLGLIAQKTDVPVERLEDLNPDLDPQNLVVGQRIKLRE